MWKPLTTLILILEMFLDSSPSCLAFEPFFKMECVKGYIRTSKVSKIKNFTLIVCGDFAFQKSLKTLHSL